MLIWIAAAMLCAQDLKDIEKRVTEFTLPNGMHFIVLERHGVPVASFQLSVNAGAVNDPEGKTGLAHMFEHLALKGTETIGSRNWTEEKRALDKIEEAYDKLDQEVAKGPRADLDVERLLKTGAKSQVDSASALAVQNLYPLIFQENGANGFKAQAEEDSTTYAYSLPANRAELWFLLESSRLTKPVYRDFYKERDTMREERRGSAESDGQGKLAEAFLATALEAHPYRRPVGGWASDIENLRVSDAVAFFAKYYVAANMTVVIVGDVKPEEMRALATKYFGPLPKKPLPTPVATEEPAQAGPKLVQVRTANQPLLMIGYHRPNQYDKDDLVFDVISEILSGGRTGLLNKQLVEGRQVAAKIAAQATLPAGRYPNLFGILALPALGKTVEDNATAIEEILDGLKGKPVEDAVLTRVKAKIRMDLVRGLESNAGLAKLLSTAYTDFGDWRTPFRILTAVEKVTPADIQRVAAQYFTADNRTVAEGVKGAAQ